MDVRRKQVMMMILAGYNPVQVMYTRLTMASQTGRNVMLGYVDADSRLLWTPIIGPYWVRWNAELLASGFWQIANYNVYLCRKPVDNPDAGITYSGTWDSFPVALTLNGTTLRSQVVGDYLEFTVTGTTEIYASITKQGNCGFGFVTINGSTSLVNGSSMLTSGANRYFNGYAASQTAGQRMQLATGLDPAASYTVRITHSAEKQAEATDTRIYFEGYVIDAYQVGNDTGMAVEKTSHLATGVVNSALEYAYQYLPTGATSYEFTGSVHANEAITAVTWKDGAGNDLTVDVGTPAVSVASVVLTNTGTTRHSETGATDHANVISRATFTYAGLDIYHSHAWLTNGVVQNGYVGMLSSVPTWSDEGCVIGGGVIDLTADDNAFKGQLKSRLAMVWNDANPWVAWLYLPDTLGVNGWANAGSDMSIQDTNVNNKIYARRCITGSTESVANGVTWESNHSLRVSYYAAVASLP